MERIPWDQYFMGQSVLLSLRSTCTRLTVGATIVRDKRIIRRLQWFSQWRNALY